MNHAQTTSFDADGRTTSVLDNLGHGPSYAYGPMGELLTTTDSLNETTTDQYDSRFRLVQTTDANGGVTQIQLDPAGNRVGLIDPDNNKTTWVFDALNRETSETNALNFTRSFSYDASSDITSETDRDGRVRDFVFDNLHRLITENWMNGGTVVYAINTSYDADNEVTSQSSPDSSYAFAFDNLGRTLTVDNSGTPNVPHVALTAGYDSANDRTSLSATIGGTADFLNNYTFDADQRLTDETQQGQNGGNGVAAKQIEFYYNALGQFTSVARYDFVGMGPMVDIATAAYGYDGGNRMTSLGYTGNSGQISIDSFAFTLDNADRITARTSSVDGTVSYGYDTTNQVTGATYSGGSGEPGNESYSYSKNGNRTNTGYSTGTNNQLLSDGTFTYQYDGEGNRTVRTRISNDPANDYRTTYTWDYRDRLTDVEYFNNSGVLTKHVHYVYDTLDHEIGKHVDDSGSGSYDRAEWYALDVSPEAPQANVPSTGLADPLLEFDQNGNLLYRYLNGPTPAGVDAVLGEEAIATQGQAGTEYWPLFDQVNTPHQVVNNASTTVDHIISNAFGVVTSESNTSIHHWAGFEGGHFDPDTVLTNDDHRWYDPVVGRWISEDPIGFGGGDANVVCYVGNNPVSQVDPVGEQLISRSTAKETGRPTSTPTNIYANTAHSSGTPRTFGTFLKHLTQTPINRGQPQPKIGQRIGNWLYNGSKQVLNFLAKPWQV
ncbi:MAG TPA: RHS repeat-associated core domain-containing protein, partial [Pirellulales bacterium]|nr:RHS repeat-associated core domain-containing protein [Pirellulales bacterium]